MTKPTANVELIHIAFTKLRDFDYSLKPVDETNGWFFQVVFELIAATLPNENAM